MVCQVINAPLKPLSVLFDGGEAHDALEEKPKVPTSFTTLGIKTPDEAPSVVTAEGVHVYAVNRKQVRALEKLCAKHPKLWVDSGPINVPLDRQMKIPLLDNYLDLVKFNSCAYPLGQKDCVLLDKRHDLLHV